jgi:hypothetical protein
VDTSTSISDSPQQAHPSDSTSSATEDHVSQPSPRKALKSILKKGRRHSKDTTVSDVMEVKEPDVVVEHIRQTDSLRSAVAEITSQHSDVEQPPEQEDLPLQSNEREDHFRRTSFQIAALDRLLFARRGAVLREEYMRDVAGQADQAGLDRRI